MSGSGSSSTGRKTLSRSSKVEAEQKIKVASTREAKERLRNKRKRDSDDSDTDSDMDDDSDVLETGRDYQPSDSEEDEDASGKKAARRKLDKWSGGETSDSESDDEKGTKSDSDVEEDSHDSVLFVSRREQVKANKKKKLQNSANGTDAKNARGRPKRVVTSILKTSLGSGDSDEDDDDDDNDTNKGDDDNDKDAQMEEENLDVATGIVTRRRLAKKAKADSKIASLGQDDSPTDILESKRDKKGRIKYSHAAWTKQNALKLKRLIKETTDLYKSYTSCAVEWSSMQTWSPVEVELKRMAKKAADFKQDYLDKRAELIQHLPFKARRVYLELDRCTEKRNELRCVLPITDDLVKNMNERIIKLLEEKKQCIVQLCKIKRVKKTADTSSDKELAKVLVKKYSSIPTPTATEVIPDYLI